MRQSQTSKVELEEERDSDSDDEDTKRQVIWDPEARNQKVLHRWKRAFFAAQLSKHGGGNREGSVQLLGEVHELVARAQKGPDPEAAVAELAMLAKRRDMRNTIVAAKALPVLCEVALGEGPACCCLTAAAKCEHL